MTAPTVPTVHNECLLCGGRKLKEAYVCDVCLASITKAGRLVRVRKDAPRHPGRMGWVIGSSGDNVQVRLNSNGTLWFSIERKWLEPVVGQ